MAAYPIRRTLSLQSLEKQGSRMDTLLSPEEILALHEADTDEGLWCAALERLGRRLGASGLALLIDHQGAESAVASGVPAPEIDALRRWLAALAPTASGTQGAWRQEGDLGWLLNDTADIEGPSGRHCVARLEKDGARLGYADLYREPGAPAFDAAAIGSFLSLAPHLAQALALALRMAAAEAVARRCAQCTDMQPFGCLLLDDTGSVIEMNCAAGEMLGSGDGLRIVDGRLHALRAADDALLARWLGEVIAHDVSAGPAFVSIPRRSGRRPYALFTSRTEARRSAFTGRLPHLRLVIVDSDRGKYVPREVLRALYELTETESRVAWQLASGDSLEQAADRLGIAHSTVRHHLERIFAKTGAHRQSDLVRLVHAPFVSIGGVR